MFILSHTICPLMEMFNRGYYSLHTNFVITFSCPYKKFKLVHDTPAHQFLSKEIKTLQCNLIEVEKLIGGDSECIAYITLIS